nr:MAG TPA: Baseplate component [Caudoviricetes sp.]
MNNIENIQEYIPTVYVNDSEPDLDETNLNKTEQAIKRVTDAANKAIDALKQLDREKLALSAISNVLSDATDKVPSLALANTMQLAINDLNSNLENCYSLSGGILIPDNADLYSDDYKVPGNYYCPGNANAATLKNCPLSKAFILKVDYTNGTQYIRQSFTQYDIEQNHQRIWNPIANKWEHESSLLTNADFLTKIVSLNQVTVPANAGIAGSTTNISGQIPSGYKLLDAREVGSGNNGCYIYYFRADGTNITLQLRNVTNAAITTSPSAQLLLIPK